MLAKYLILPLLILSLFSHAQEFRGVWISTVFNKDWPSKAGLTTEEQQKELIRQLDLHKNNGINAIIFQVRTTSDALYESKIEPWSQWLSGKQGVAPDPYYDPLEFIIEEAHKRDMELHAWLNPYRAEIDKAKKASTPDQVSQQHPEWCIPYGRRNYLDPGIPAVRDYIASIVKDIIIRYEVDGIHFDDYFYPYKIKGENFNDNGSFRKYGKDFDDKAEWRRDNVNKTVQLLYETIKNHDERLKFGISPFGIWRNKREHPDGSATNGMTNYHGLYADVRYWMQQQWLDYVIPQLYWPIGDTAADFATLTDWWNDNSYDRHVYIGIGLFNVDKRSKKAQWRQADQIDRQIEYLRTKDNIQGMCFFTSTSFERNPFGINQKLSTNYFATLSTTPAMPWKEKHVAVVETATVVQRKDTIQPNITKIVIQDSLPEAPTNFRIVKQKSRLLFAWDAPIHTNTGMYTIYRFGKRDKVDLKNGETYAKTVRTKLLVKRKRWILFRKKYKFVVSFTHNGKESPPSEITFAKLKKREASPLLNPSIIEF